MSFHKSELADMLRKKYGQVSAVCCRLPTLGVPTRYSLAARIAAERSCSTLIHGSRTVGSHLELMTAAQGLISALKLLPVLLTNTRDLEGWPCHAQSRHSGKSSLPLPS
jgi:hypothetical protein